MQVALRLRQFDSLWVGLSMGGVTQFRMSQSNDQYSTVHVLSTPAAGLVRVRYTVGIELC